LKFFEPKAWAVNAHAFFTDWGQETQHIRGRTFVEEGRSTMENRTLERVRELIAPIVADLKLDLYDLEFRGGTLRVTLDTPPGGERGVSIDEISLASRLIGRDLDHHDPVPGHYTLEVTSPGLERTLRTPAHFQREMGKTVNIRLRDVVNGERRIQGVLVSADERGATLRLESPPPDSADERTVTYDQIDRARTVFVWGPQSPKQAVSRTEAT
jgi:ribosome maturation factor RimP